MLDTSPLKLLSRRGASGDFMVTLGAAGSVWL